MEKSIQKAVLDFFVKNGYTMKYGGSIELLSSIYAADVMATVKWWIYNYFSKNKKKGISPLLLTFPPSQPPCGFYQRSPSGRACGRHGGKGS